MRQGVLLLCRLCLVGTVVTEFREPPEDFVLLGRLGRTFGIQGALHFRPLGAAEAKAIAELKRVFVTGVGDLSLSEVRRHGTGLVVSFETVRRPERAQQLVNAFVYASPELLPELSDEGPYLELLHGYPVLVDGRPFGTIAEVTGVTGAEILVVERPEGGQVLLPLRAPYLQVSEQSVMLVDPPPGLIPTPDEQ